MRKLGLILAVLLTTSTAHAGIKETLDKVPAIKQGIAYSIADGKLNYLATFEVAKYKGLTFEAGYAGYAENTGAKLVAVASYELVKLRDLGVTLPILDLIEFNPGIYVGVGQINVKEMDESETDWGVSATLMKWKF